MAKEDFPKDRVYDELGRWFHERHVAADLEVKGALLRVASLHATPAASKGPAGKGVGPLKPSFHQRMGEWMATWDIPFLFGVDANAPGVEALDWDLSQMIGVRSPLDIRLRQGRWANGATGTSCNGVPACGAGRSIGIRLSSGDAEGGG